MTQLVCPFCGSRELREFEFRKTASTLSANAFAQVYLRVEQLETSVEHWQHVLGCRAWLTIRRNPTTGVVTSIQLLNDPSE